MNHVPGSVTVIASSLTVTRRPISLPLLITLVAVSSLDRRIRFSPYVLRKRTASMVRLFELILFVSPHVSLVRASVDEFSLGSHDLLPKFPIPNPTPASGHQFAWKPQP